jgi:hypothetical protein
MVLRERWDLEGGDVDLQYVQVQRLMNINNMLLGATKLIIFRLFGMNRAI